MSKNNECLLSEDVRNRWQSVIESDQEVAPITNPAVRNNVIRLLENQVNIGGELHEGADGAGSVSSNTNAASTKNWDPILISLVRRTAPSLIANRLMGVQPMDGPTGLIFSMKAHSTSAAGVTVQDLYAPGKTPDPNLGGGTAANPSQDSMTTAELEALGKSEQTGEIDQSDTTTTDLQVAIGQVSPWAEISFTIDQKSVTAQGKALKAQYTVELAHDLKKIHGMDAEAVLTDLLGGELTAEINREVVNTLFSQAITTLARTASFSHASSGGYDFYNYQNKVAAEGVYNLAVDSDGRWEAEHFRNLVGMVNRVAHEVALGTRRGLGNVIITDPITASALDSATRTTGPADSAGGLQFGHDNVGVTYAGRLLGRYDVFVDPYMTTNEILVGYKGANEFDAGFYYCPYVPFTIMRATGENDFQPRIGFKTRYGMTANPFVTGSAGENWYYRKFTVSNV